MHTLTRTHQHNWQTWRRNSFKKKRKKENWNEEEKHCYQANQRPQDKLPTFHRSNWSSLSSPIIPAETHLTLSTCSDALMWKIKIYFKYEKDLVLHVDTGFTLVFLYRPDSTFQHKAFQNEFSPTLNPSTNIYILLSLPAAIISSFTHQGKYG